MQDNREDLHRNIDTPDASVGISLSRSRISSSGILTDPFRFPNAYSSGVRTSIRVTFERSASLRLAPIDRLHLPLENVPRHVSGKSHRVFRCGERRRVGMLYLGKVAHGASLLDYECKFIHTLVNTVITYNLCAVKPAILRREGHFYAHRHRTGIVSGMGVGMYRG